MYIRYGEAIACCASQDGRMATGQISWVAQEQLGCHFHSAFLHAAAEVLSDFTIRNRFFFFF